MKIAAAYIRVSTEDQLEYSPDSQLKLIREYARSHGFCLPDPLIFREADGVSGRSVKKRPQFQRMIAAARTPENKIEAILVWKFSRFARNQEESIVYKSLLRRERGIPVISVSEPIDPSNEFGTLIERIIEWMDGYYSTRLAGEVRRGMAERFSRGEPVSIAPFGYRLEGGRLIIDPTKAETVRSIFNRFVNGAGYRTIARQLNDLGIPTNNGGLWEDRAIEYILRNPAYTGKLRWNPTGKTGRQFENPAIQLSEGHHQPIIPQPLWQQVQERITACEELRKTGERHSSAAHLLQGLLRCSTCGKVLTASGAGYQCTAYIHGKCRISHYISSIKLERVVLSAVHEDLKGIRLYIPNRELPPDYSEKEQITCQLRASRARLMRIQASYENGIDTLEEYRSNKERIERQIKMLEKQATQALTETESLSKIRETPTDSLPIADQNQLLHLFIHHIIVDSRRSTIKIFYSV